jgi:hypothetical protein
VNTLILRSDSSKCTIVANPADFDLSKTLMKEPQTRKPGLALLAACVLLCALPLSAQSTRRPRRESTANRKARIQRTIDETYGHRWETGGGGGYLRFRTGQYQQQTNEITFWASTLYALNPKLGVIGEVRGAYGNAKVGNILPSGNVLPYNPQVSEYSFMAGPSYRFVRKEKFSVSGFAEGGGGIGKFAGDAKGLSAQDIGVWTGNYGASFSVGANLDYNLYPNLAFRVTPNYLGTTYGGTLQNSKGLNLGLVYRFGQIK